MEMNDRDMWKCECDASSIYRRGAHNLAFCMCAVSCMCCNYRHLICVYSSTQTRNKNRTYSSSSSAHHQHIPNQPPLCKAILFISPQLSAANIARSCAVDADGGQFKGTFPLLFGCRRTSHSQRYIEPSIHNTRQQQMLQQSKTNIYPEIVAPSADHSIGDDRYNKMRVPPLLLLLLQIKRNDTNMWHACGVQRRGSNTTRHM